jgi:hypothetical protein
MAVTSTLPTSISTLLPGARLADVSSLAGSISGGMGNNVNGSLVASTTQTQAGGTKLAYGMNDVLTANASDAATMPKAVSGTMLLLVNHSGQTIQLFPAVGDNINAAAANAAVSVATATTSIYICSASSTQWWGGAITNEA